MSARTWTSPDAVSRQRWSGHRGSGVRPDAILAVLMSDLPMTFADPGLTARLAASLDVEGKIPRALEALGPVGGRDVLLVDGEGGLRAGQLAGLGARVAIVSGADPAALVAVPEASADAVVACWTAFRADDGGWLAAADRALRSGRSPARRARLRSRRRLATHGRPARVRRLEPSGWLVPAARLPDPGHPRLLDVRHARRGTGLPGRRLRTRRCDGRRHPSATRVSATTSRSTTGPAARPARRRHDRRRRLAAGGRLVAGRAGAGRLPRPPGGEVRSHRGAVC